MNSEIKLKIRNEEDLYHPYDPDRTTLNPDVIDYITLANKDRQII